MNSTSTEPARSHRRAVNLPGPFGEPVARVDGRAKVTGAARYAAEHFADGLLYGVVVSATIARGRMLRIDTAAARAVPGVFEVMHHGNRLPMSRFDLMHKDIVVSSGSPSRLLDDDRVLSEGQPVALVVAESFEAARHAARLVHIDYAAEPHRSDLHARLGDARKPGRLKFGFTPPPKPRGDAEGTFAAADIKMEAEYLASSDYHNPMEMFATTAVWDGPGKRTVYDKTQGAQNSRMYLAHALKLKKENVRVLCPYVGGAFGSGLRPQYQSLLAAMAALKLQRPVRVVLTRQQMFTFGHRPEAVQTLKLSCAPDGLLTSVQHSAVTETSRNEDYVEVIVNWSALLYPCDNVALDFKVVPLDRFTPMDMRAPGAVTGVHALECAMDGLTYAAGLDPLEPRLRNYAERDHGEDEPFSSKALPDRYAQGAERFGWARRTRCATAAPSSAGAWRPACGARCRCPAPPARCCRPKAPWPSAALAPTSVPAPTPSHGRTVEVTRIVTAIAAGRIVNPRTATSQIQGGVVWGIRHALHEEALHDHRFGKVVNHSFAEYHVPVNRDIGEIEVLFVPEEDDVVNPLGVKGVGEIGAFVGCAARGRRRPYTGGLPRRLPAAARPAVPIGAPPAGTTMLFRLTQGRSARRACACSACRTSFADQDAAALRDPC